MTRDEANALYDKVLAQPDAAQRRYDMRELAKHDLFFLLTRVLKRKDIDRDWLYDRCLEVERDPDGHLDLWARNHYKSTVITWGKSIQDILCDPEITIGIFSHTRPIAKAFLKQIKRELETNEILKELFPDVLFDKPWKDSPSWSEDEGIIVKRVTNPKEATVEAWGLVDSQPTGKHFNLMVYDDVVERRSVNTPDQIAKTTEGWELSLNLASEGARVRYIGTRYHLHDTYKVVMERKAALPRVHTATVDGTDTGAPVLLSAEELAKKRSAMGPYVFACQMLQNPVADTSQGFDSEWLQYWQPLPQFWESMNRVILVDPANSKKQNSDYSVFCVVGWNADRRRYLIHGVRDRLNLTERARMLFRLVREYRPLFVAYEQYGMQADIEHIQSRMRETNFYFQLQKVGGGMSKIDRIRRLIPEFEGRRMFLPISCTFLDAQGNSRNFTQEFVEDEYSCFPVLAHDDMLDCLARCLEPEIQPGWPQDTATRLAPNATGNGGVFGSVRDWFSRKLDLKYDYDGGRQHDVRY